MTSAASTALHFNWVDYAIISIVLLSTIIGVFRGFLREAISLAAWVIGFVVSLKYAMTVQAYFVSWFSSESVRYFIAFIGLFFITVLVGLLINMLLHAILKATGLSIPDRFLGIIFGIMRGMTIVSVILLMLMNMGTAMDSAALDQSRLAPKFKPAVRWLNGYLPDKIKTVSQWVLNDYNAVKRA